MSRLGARPPCWWPPYVSIDPFSSSLRDQVGLCAELWALHDEVNARQLNQNVPVPQTIFSPTDVRKFYFKLFFTPL